MNKKQKHLDKKIFSYLAVILFIITIFSIIGSIVNINTSEDWNLRYKLKLNERALIYLRSIDTVITELKVGSHSDTKLQENIEEIIRAQSSYLDASFADITNINISQNFLTYATTKKIDFEKFANEIIKLVNIIIHKELNSKLLLYYDIAKETVKEQNQFNLNQGTNISELDNLVEFFIFNGVNNQTSEITELKKVLNDLNISLTLENIELLRKQYSNAGIEDNLLLVKLKRLTSDIQKLEIIKYTNVEKISNKKASLISSIISFAFVGLVFSLTCIYFYLTFSIDLLRKKLLFLQNLK